MDAMHAAEAVIQGASVRRIALLQEAAQLRGERAKLKRAHSNLFAAEGIV